MSSILVYNLLGPDVYSVKIKQPAAAVGMDRRQPEVVLENVIRLMLTLWLKKLSQCFSNVDYMLNIIANKLCNIPEIFC